MKKQIIYLSLAANIVLMAYGAYVFLPQLLKTVSSKTATLFTSNKSQHRPWVTVWVHGTRLVKYPVFNNFFEVPKGLTCSTELPKELHHQQIATTLCTEDPVHFTPEHCYLFGWSGELSFEARELAAQNLASDIKKILAEYHRKGLCPQLRVITHSHGGNIALNLAQEEQSFTIDELVLLACPVQEKTKLYSNNSLFKKVFVLYSPWDMIQIIDPQGLYKDKEENTPTFSERTFPLAANLYQVELWSNNRGPMHIEFLLCDALSGIVRLLPQILTATQEQFATGYPADEPKPVKKLMIHDDRSLEWL